MRRTNQHAALRQYRALVDRAFVGDFAFVNRRWLVHDVHDVQARNAVCAARGRLCKVVDQVLKITGFWSALQNLLRSCLRRQTGQAAHRGSWENKRAHFFVIDAG